MRRIGLTVVLALGLTLAPLVTEAQQAGKVYRIGMLFNGSPPPPLAADEIKARLTAEKARKTALEAELTKLGHVAQVVSLDAARLKKTLEERVSDVAGLLGRHTAQGRQMLRKILADKIQLEPVGSGRQRGYRFRGALAIDRLIGGEALQTSLSMVAPRGFGMQTCFPQPAA